jgi:hypothetical protein
MIDRLNAGAEEPTAEIEIDEVLLQTRETEEQGPGEEATDAENEVDKPKGGGRHAR